MCDFSKLPLGKGDGMKKAETLMCTGFRPLWELTGSNRRPSACKAEVHKDSFTLSIVLQQFIYFKNLYFTRFFT
jgi:hypothetical protein